VAEHPTPLEVLRGARELLAYPERWIKGEDAADVIGQPLENGYDEGAVCWCLAGALEKVSGRTQDCGVEPAYQAVDDLIVDATNVREWNDAPERTHAEVLALLDRAIASAEGA
jgi:hypothetical protein